MPDLDKIDEILCRLDRDPNIITSLVILKSGMLVAGRIPDEVELETFVIMASLLISAAETATSELRGKLQNVLVYLNNSRIIIESAGRKGALVVMTNKMENNGHLNDIIKKAALSLSDAL